MIFLDVADLVVIAGGALGVGTGATLDLLDVAAAETALAEATFGDGTDPAAAAAALLDAMTRQHPFRRGNELVAVAAALQFLAINGWRADLDPPGTALAVIAGLATGKLTAADLAAWLAPRLSPRDHPRAQEALMRRWLPGRNRPARHQGTLDRLTCPARQVFVAAHQEARGLGHSYIGTEHVLLGLLSEGDGVAARALASLGISPEAARQHVEDIVGPGQKSPSGHIPFTLRAKKVLELSLREAMLLDHLYVGTEHILLGLIREGGGVAAQVLVKLGADLNGARGAVQRLLADHRPDDGHQQTA
jgi:prophage maintenance system killer protein